MILRNARLPWPPFRARIPLLPVLLLLGTCCCGPHVHSQLLAAQEPESLLAGKVIQQAVGTKYSYFFPLQGRNIPAGAGDLNARAKASLNITVTRAGPLPSYKMTISLQLYGYNKSCIPEVVAVYRGSSNTVGKPLTGFIGAWNLFNPPGTEADYTGVVPNTTRVNVKAFNCTLSKALEYLILYPGFNYVIVQGSLHPQGSVRGQLVKTLPSR